MPALNNSTGSTYGVAVCHPAQQSWYMVTGYDFDGTVSKGPVLRYSPEEKTGKPTITAYPNPARAGQAIQLQVEGLNDDLAIQWVNTSGQVTKQEGQSTSNGTHVLYSPKVAGTYMLRINSATGSYTRLIQVQ